MVFNSDFRVHVLFPKIQTEYYDSDKGDEITVHKGNIYMSMKN